MNVEDKELLEKVSDTKDFQSMAYNIRKDGKAVERKITEDVSIVNKEDGSGIDIYIKESAKNAFVYIPVLLTKSGLEDIVYNDFHIGKNAQAIIMAGCAIRNNANKNSRHQGIHRFYLEENSKVKYIEKHYGEGHGSGHKVLDPITELYLGKNSTMDMDTVQIEGVDSTVRVTKGTLEEKATLTISEKIMTSKEQYAKTEFEVNLKGKDSSAHVTSRSVATEQSHQLFISRLNGYNQCYGHVECDAILKDEGTVQAIPEVNAQHIDARLIHEATIGKIAGEQLTKLMTLGLTETQAEEQIINGFLK